MNQMNAIVCNSFIFTLTSDGIFTSTSDGDQEVETSPAVSEPTCQVNFFSYKFISHLTLVLVKFQSFENISFSLKTYIQQGQKG